MLLFIVSLGEKTSCRNGWELVLEGEYINYNVCLTQSSEPRYQLCSDVYDSSNTENYWCIKGEPIVPDSLVEPNVQVNEIVKRMHCTVKGCI